MYGVCHISNIHVSPRDLFLALEPLVTLDGGFVIDDRGGGNVRYFQSVHLFKVFILSNVSNVFRVVKVLYADAL